MGTNNNKLIFETFSNVKIIADVKQNKNINNAFRNDENKKPHTLSSS